LLSLLPPTTENFLKVASISGVNCFSDKSKAYFFGIFDVAGTSLMIGRDAIILKVKILLVSEIDGVIVFREVSP
jgi:hypothetical protein